MRIESASLDGLFIITPERKADARGFFAELFHQEKFAAHGISFFPVQENISHSTKGVARGLHFQWNPPLAKLIRVIRGRAFVIAVDIRTASPTFGQWFGFELDSEQGIQMFVPPGFASGFCVLENAADVQYLYSACYNPNGEASIRFDDPTIGIAWPVSNPIVSDRDKAAYTLEEWMLDPRSRLWR